MSIIINGMKMPANCEVCPHAFCHLDTRNCPLRELPEKHGRLIDADEFLERFLSVDRTVSFGASGLYVDIHDLYKILSSLPTVIEAEGE